MTDFRLQHSDTPQVTLLDEDPVTTHWTLPPVRKWEPAPRASVWQQLKDALLGRDDE